LCTENSLYIKWESDDEDDENENTSGYQLFMYDVKQDKTTLVYDGQSNPNKLEFNVLGLTPGNQYGFTVVAFNFNGQSEPSEMTTYTVCSAPSGQMVPIVTSTTATSITFKW